MYILFENLILECLRNKILCTGVGLSEEGGMFFEFDGFSKSGTAKLYMKNHEIICETRYNTIDIIENFKDFAYVAYTWQRNYMDRIPFNGWDKHWLPIFRKYGWVEDDNDLENTKN